MSNKKKLGYLVGLLVLWGIVTFFQWNEFSGSEPPGTSPQTDRPPTPLASLPIKDLQLEKDFPNARRAVKLSNPRNIFAPLGSASIQVAKTSQPSTQRNSTTQAIRNQPPPPPPTPPGPSPGELAAQRARQELTQFRFLGFLTKGGESQAFLTNGQAIYIVKQGEMLEGRVQVHKIEPETVTLSTKIWETGNVIQAAIPLTPDTNG
ncbi:MAG: hypothetical protein KC563_11530 [Nitrospira sp.]|nr:hypothetical protein [Nitrospira sp.]MCA9481105.1 hypothetical protein [Nitrospira sp.]